MGEVTYTRTFEDPVLGTVYIVKGRAQRSMSIRLSRSGEVTVSIPSFVTYQEGMDFFHSRREEVLAMHDRFYARIMEANSRYAADGRSYSELAEVALREFPARLSELAGRYGFKYGSISIRANVSRWGSCSRKGDISLNLRLVQLPSLLRDYVFIHELCHLDYFDHSSAFHSLLEELNRDNYARTVNAVNAQLAAAKALDDARARDVAGAKAANDAVVPGGIKAPDDAKSGFSTLAFPDIAFGKGLPAGFEWTSSLETVITRQDAECAFDIQDRIRATRSVRPVSLSLEHALKNWILP